MFSKEFLHDIEKYKDDDDIRELVEQLKAKVNQQKETAKQKEETKMNEIKEARKKRLELIKSITPLTETKNKIAEKITTINCVIESYGEDLDEQTVENLRNFVSKETDELNNIEQKLKDIDDEIAELAKKCVFRQSFERKSPGGYSKRVAFEDGL